MLHQAEDIALGRTRGIPPAAAVVVDNDDLAGAAPVFQRALGALARVELPASPDLLRRRRSSRFVGTAPVRHRWTSLGSGVRPSWSVGALPFPFSASAVATAAKPEGGKGAAGAAGPRARAGTLAALPASAAAVFASLPALMRRVWRGLVRTDAPFAGLKNSAIAAAQVLPTERVLGQLRAEREKMEELAQSARRAGWLASRCAVLTAAGLAGWLINARTLIARQLEWCKTEPSLQHSGCLARPRRSISLK